MVEVRLVFIDGVKIRRSCIAVTIRNQLYMVHIQAELDDVSITACHPYHYGATKLAKDYFLKCAGFRPPKPL
jgi:predicted glutamine amidotransferase